MKTVYETTNAADAHIVSNLLQQHGIDASVVGQELGPYTHALGAVRVLVAADKEPAARDVVGDWEASAPGPQEAAAETQDARPVSRMPSRETALLLVGALLLLVVLWYFTGV